jgi:hypothetical protein
MATITLSGQVAAKFFRDAAARKMKERPAVSQDEKRWSRWANVAEEFGDHEITVSLDEMHLMIVAGAPQKRV